MDKPLTHGSLFAGIGGFELAAKECGIRTLFSCEIEPYPRLVLAARFPEVKQYGDINKLNGADVPPVDILTFGSPCQSFSVAGARAGLDGASGLFYQAARVIREMRAATNGEYPKYAIMENVPGIYSSKSSGKSDFREVLNELLKIRDETVDVPLPQNGKFLTAGAVMGDTGSACGGYSLAWRTLCASQFGVPQRRRRMFLVVSFADERASEILSEQAGERRDFTPGYRKGQDAARTAEAGFGVVAAGAAFAFEPGALKRIDRGCWQDQARTLRADSGDNKLAVAYPLDLRNAIRNGGGQGTGVGSADEPGYTVTAEYTHGVAAVENHPQDARLKIRDDGKYPSITQRFGSGGGNTHFVLSEPTETVCLEGNGQRPSHNGNGVKAEQSFTLDTVQQHAVIYKEALSPFCYQKNVGTLAASDSRGIRNQDIGEDKAIVETFVGNGCDMWSEEPTAQARYAVRRLTPLECLRLQGYPDWWLDGIHIEEPLMGQLDYWRFAWAELGKKKSDNQLRKWLGDPYSDSNAYKAIGNSLAVPCAIFVMRGIVDKAQRIQPPKPICL